jgi:hypothetical protein
MADIALPGFEARTSRWRTGWIGALLTILIVLLALNWSAVHVRDKAQDCETRWRDAECRQPQSDASPAGGPQPRLNPHHHRRAAR